MFTRKICLATVLLSLQTANSYILLTANLDDVHSLAKQIAESPVMNQIHDIIRRTASNFNDHNLEVREHDPEHIHMRSDTQLDEELHVGRRENSMEKTEKIVPHPKNAERLKTAAAPARDKDDPEVWTPDKNAAAPARDKDDPEVWTPDKNAAAPARDKDDPEVWTPDKNALAAELNSQISDSSSDVTGEKDVKPSGSKDQMRRSDDGAEVVELGKNASFYLTSMKKIIESV